jgi:hypothetical protein
MVFTKIDGLFQKENPEKWIKKLGKPIHDLLETKNLRDETCLKYSVVKSHMFQQITMCFIVKSKILMAKSMAKLPVFGRVRSHFGLMRCD